jgi:hypothetical protein
VALFFAFEASRAVWLGEFLWPWWREIGAHIGHMASLSPLAASVAFAVAILTFVAPMAGVLLALRWLHRRLSRNGTVVNSLLTKLNFR